MNASRAHGGIWGPNNFHAAFVCFWSVFDPRNFGNLHNNLMKSLRMIGKRAIEGMLIGQIAVTLTACGPVPKPFQTRAELGPPGLIQRDINGGVWVSIVDGPSARGLNLLSEAIAQGLVARGIPAMTKDGGSLRYKLTGRVTERAPDQSGAAVIKIYWSLNEQNNKPVFYFSQDLRKDQQRGSLGAIWSVGANTARLIAEVVEPEDETLMPAQAISHGVWVQPVRGAPGDGDKSLTRAIRYALVKAKVAVTSERLTARHILTADVRVGAMLRGQQAVAISWTLTYPDGRHIGRAIQRNAVPVGSFDGRWGETAVIIATAAVGGIKDVLAQADNTARFHAASEPKRLKTDSVRGDEVPSLPPPNLSSETGLAPKGQ